MADVPEEYPDVHLKDVENMDELVRVEGRLVLEKENDTKTGTRGAPLDVVLPNLEVAHAQPAQCLC